jgi:hypothetical protein
MDVCKPQQWASIGNVSVPPHRSLHGHRFFGPPRSRSILPDARAPLPVRGSRARSSRRAQKCLHAAPVLAACVRESAHVDTGFETAAPALPPRTPRPQGDSPRPFRARGYEWAAGVRRGHGDAGCDGDARGPAREWAVWRQPAVAPLGGCGGHPPHERRDDERPVAVRGEPGHHNLVSWRRPLSMQSVVGWCIGGASEARTGAIWCPPPSWTPRKHSLSASLPPRAGSTP